MVREREPPRPVGLVPMQSKSQALSQAQNQAPLQERVNIQSLPQSQFQPPVPSLSQGKPQPQPQSQSPQFGIASPLRNPLVQNKQKSIFIQPKPGQPRPEHHRNLHQTSANNPPYKRPIVLDTPSPENSVIEIPRPATFIPTYSIPRVQPVFSSVRPQTFVSVNAFKKPLVQVDLTKRAGDDDDSDGGFDPDKALGIDRFGSYDPSNFVDAAQASDNIKALLEGVFEDDNDKPKTRARRKKQDDAVAAVLSDKLKSLNMESKPNEKDTPGQEQEEEEDEDEDDGTVEGLKVKLLPHQIDGLAWMLDKEIGERKKNGVLPKGGILADDMGLGKTIQALSLILSNPRPSEDELSKDKKRKIPEIAGKGTLVVAPLALIKQWEAEINTKVETFPKMKVLVHHGATRTKRFEDLKKYDVVITTYQTLTSEHEGSSPTEQGLKVGCFGVHWYRVILDEAHSIKNRNAKMTKAAYALKSVYRWCLTGTPMQNNLDELQSLIHFLRIKPYNDLHSWKEQITQPMKNGKGGLAMKRLQYFLKAFMKRRTKDVLKKEGGLNFGKNTQANGDAKIGGFRIVARNVETVVAEFDDSERVLYDRLAARTEKSLQDMMGSSRNDYIGALVLLLRLRQACNHPDLIRGNLKKDKDAMGGSSQTTITSQTPRKALAGTDNVDDIADMFGALTVETKKCDVCQSKLDKSEVAAGAIRCADCEMDLDTHRRRSMESSKKSKALGSKHDNSIKHESHSVVDAQPLPRRRNMKRVVDSDDEEEEEEEGDWIVPPSQQQHEDLGRAGGTDDEDAEGGGESLGDDDSDTDDEVQSGLHTSSVKKKKASTRSKQDSFISHDDSFYSQNDDSTATASVFPASSPISHTGPISSTKIRYLLRLLHAETPTHKFIVFSEFTSMLDLIEPFLLAATLRFCRYDGSMKNDDREASLEKLRNDEKTRVLLCSLRCGSLGLNLTAASRVVILEPFWNPFVEEQAIDRVHRLNQTRDVTVYRLTISGTVEERILDLQAKKRELANAAIEGAARKDGLAKLSMRDILSLFKRDADVSAGHDGGVGVDGRVEKRTDAGGFVGMGMGRSMGLLEPVATVSSSPRKPFAPAQQQRPLPSGPAIMSAPGQGQGQGHAVSWQSQTQHQHQQHPRHSATANTGYSNAPKFVIPPSLRNEYQKEVRENQAQSQNQSQKESQHQSQKQNQFNEAYGRRW